MDRIATRPAATIVVIRERKAVLEILMLRRSLGVAAAPGAHVFPGGGLDRDDDVVAERGLIFGLSEELAASRLALAKGALAHYAAALRELFEEAGILVARRGDGQAVTLDSHELARWRREVLDGEVAWTELLEREGLRLDASRVAYVAHWVTPEGWPRRFDTRFFAVAAPEGQEALPDGTEVDEASWRSAQEVLALADAGEWTLLAPTRHTLESLTSMTSVDEFLLASSLSPVVRIQPRIVEGAGRPRVVLPGEPGYDPTSD